jgi:acetyltransferase-like isoleucine patch superfamily enzyme
MLNHNMGNIVTAGVCFTNNIETGNFGIYNLNATIGHDCVIKDFINIAPGANISGNVCLDELSYIGTGAAVLQGRDMNKKILIGRGSMVGAGAVVTKNVGAGLTVAGVPAKPLNAFLR